jgi:hypothetical protein
MVTGSMDNLSTADRSNRCLADDIEPVDQAGIDLRVKLLPEMSSGYDPFGNAWVATNSGVPLAGNTPTSNVFNGNNQMNGTSYDGAGNQSSVNGNTTRKTAWCR